MIRAWLALVLILTPAAALAKPVVSGCGTSPTLNDQGHFGAITTGTGVVTSCTVTFIDVGAAPICFVSINSLTVNTAIIKTASNAFTIGLSVSLPSTEIDYFCSHAIK